MGVGADNAVAGTSGFVLDAVEHGGVVVGDEVGHDNADDLWCLLTQTLCKGVGPIVEALGQFFHAFLHLQAYFWRGMECPADGGNADA